MMQSALLVTAHPDDEILWFGGTILAHLDLNWTIVCATYSQHSPRGQDFLQVCHQLNAQGILLGLDDVPSALLDEALLADRLGQIAQRERWKIVLTHNANGEYGHVHHRQVNQAVRRLWKDVIQSGFGAPDINTVVRLPEAILNRKRALFEVYQSAGKHARMRLYPPYRLDYEPLVIPESVTLAAAEKIASQKSWKELVGPIELAQRESEGVRRIAVLADTRGWAHDVIISQVKRNLPPEFALDIFFLYDEHFTEQLPLHIDEDDYDLIHLLSWRYWAAIEEQRFPPHKLITTLIGHRGVDRNSAHFLEVMSHFERVSVVSPRLFSDLQATIPNLYLTPCGVDTQTFTPSQQGIPSRFSFGTVGRHYVVENEPDDIKGWKSVLEPLTRRLPSIKAHYLQVDKAASIPHEHMPDFYRQCCCYLCASKTEGLPLPLLEAASCGLILLSTDVGIAPEIIVEGQNGSILPRDVEAFAQAIRRLSEQPERWDAMGRHSRKIVLNGWDWWSLAPRWAEFYRAAC